MGAVNDWGNAPVTKEKEPEIRACLSRLMASLDSLQKTVAVLEQRVAPVTVNRDEPNKEAAELVSVRTEVGARINEAAGLVCGIETHIADITRRIQL